MYAVILDEVFTAITCFTVHFILFDYKLRAESIVNSKLAAEKWSHLADTQLDFSYSHNAVFDRGWYKYMQISVWLSVVATSYNMNHSSTNFVLPLWRCFITLCIILYTDKNFKSALHEQ